MRGRMILVIAGNQRQYLQWIDQHGFDKTNTRYVSRHEDYKGLRDCHYVLVGEYRVNQVYRDTTGEFLAYA